MSYQVVVNIQSVLVGQFASVEDFRSNTTFEGINESNFVTDTYNKLINNDLATQAEADRYVQIENGLTTTCSAWDNVNQSYTQTRTFQSEDDYNFLDLMYERAYYDFRNNIRLGLYTITRL